MNEVQSVYIHIPFCQQMCHYCDFVKYFYNEKLATEYIEALANEINTNIAGTKNKIRTIYIGGGTPSALNLQQLRSLLTIIDTKFDIASCEEFTIEVNPGDIDDEKTKLLKDFGITRISFGVQVMDDKLLTELGRIHRVSDVYHTVDLLTKHQFSNISLDLIYALPNQTVDQFKQSLDEVLAFNLPHYATYGLQIEPRTVFYQRHKKGLLHRPSEDDEITMYEILKQTMKANGVRQYEISNFAKPGYESKHNLTYWSNGYYYGFGAGAHGYLPDQRITNLRPLPAYKKEAMTSGRPILQTEEITLKEKLEEEMFLGLRKIAGINKQSFTQKYGFPPEKLYKLEITDLVDHELLKESETTIQLTDKGMLLANQVFEKFMLEDSDLVGI
ncbi:coproporphyrinogen III oxidase [Oceanobacillus arenosus]|uniref:Heme chaperone HemW n=1 Tax=Oceanobacillus arenosus TaxID=1229153 RepID=A0A3D8PTC5_9BACI|nr:radical SAM family heme chaperone HemW [Oceanobacillus arenosus]RDW19244.1 coproporphyrinogen III oxidase [Oceanobacillus arenosus]